VVLAVEKKKEVEVEVEVEFFFPSVFFFFSKQLRRPRKGL